MRITPQMVEALDSLREFALAVKQERNPHPVDKRAAEAVILLDNEDFFTAVDEARED